MIRKAVFVFIVLFAVVSSDAQVTIQKRISLNNSNNAYSRDIVETTPGNFVLIGVGFDTVGTQIERNLTVVGTDNNGNVQWRKTYGNNKFYYTPVGGSYSLFFKHNGFLYAAAMARDSNNVWPGVILKLNYNGDTLWQRKIYDTNPTTQFFIHSISPSVDNGLLITGAIQTNTPGFNNHPIVGLYLLKTDINGNKLWEKRIYKSNLDKTIVGSDLVQDAASKKIILVGIEDYDSGGNGGNIMIFDSLGNKLKQKGGLPDQGFLKLIQSKEGNYIGAGFVGYQTQIMGFTTNRCLLGRFDTTCALKFYKEYDTLAIFNYLSAIRELPNGDIIGGGGQELLAKHSGGINEACKIMRFDKNGNLLWKKYFDNIKDNANNDGLSGLCITTAGDIAFTSFAEGSLFSPVTFMFYRTDTSYCDVNAIGCYSYAPVGINELKIKNEELEIYPNPANEIINVECKMLNESALTNLKVQDGLGRLVLNVEMHYGKAEVDISGLESGIYFMRIETEQGTLQRKILKE